MITGKEALIALANGQEVEFDAGTKTWHKVHDGLTLRCFDSYKFRLKPRTISINGVEVPAPFEPNIFESYFTIANNKNGYVREIFNPELPPPNGAPKKKLNKLLRLCVQCLGW